MNNNKETMFFEVTHLASSTLYVYLTNDQAWRTNDCWEGERVQAMKEINGGQMVPVDVRLGDLEIVEEC